MKKIYFLVMMLVMVSGVSWGQTPVPMSSQPGLTYTENFADIANWANGFATGVGANRWGSVAINASGTIGDGIKTTVSTASFTSGTSGGVQKGTGLIQMLSTSTANACAVDFFLDFTSVNAGTISFDVATVFNSTGDRDSKLRLFYSTNGTTFTEITGTNLPYTARNNVSSSASINIALPSALNGLSTVRLRFYEHSTTTGATPTGSQPKISIDNVVVTATASVTPSVTVSTSSLSGFSSLSSVPSAEQSYTVSGTNLTADITVTPPAGYQISTTSGSGFGTSPITLTQSGGTVSNTTIFARLNSATLGANSGDITNASTGATTQNVSLTGKVLATEPTTQGVLSFGTTTNSTLEVNFTSGDGAKRILLAKQASVVNSNPVDGTTYTDNSAFGSGTQIGTGNYVVYAGTGNTVTVTGLSAGTAYHFALYEYNDGATAGAENYLLTSPGTGNTNTTSNATTYVWSGGNGSWTTASNWTPARTTPATNDKLEFSDGSTVIVTSVPTQSISQLKITNNTVVTLQAGSAVTLSLAGTSGTDLEVFSGSQLNLDGASAISINLATGTTANVLGSMNFTGTTHRLTAVDASAILFQSGSSFTAGTGFSGNAFGTSNLNSVVFQSGAVYNQIAGSNPFGASQPNSVVVFQTGSLFKLLGNLSPSISGRTYANFELDYATTPISVTASSAFSVDNLTITQGSLTLGLTGIPGHSIKRNVSVAAGATLNFSPASAGTLNLNGTTASQTITNAGTLTFGANQTLVIANTAAIPSVTFNQAQTFLGPVTVNSGSVLATNATLTLDGAASVNGSFQLNEGGWATGSGTWTYGAAGTLVFNNSSGSYGVNSDVFWPSTNGPVNVTVQNTGGITMNVARTVTGLFQTSAGITNANNLTFNGTFQLNAGGYVSGVGRPVYGPASLLKYNTGGTYGRGNEWYCSGGAGCPNNLQISNSTVLNVPNGVPFTQGQIQGNLTIDAGSAMYMDYGGVGQNWLIEVYKDVVLNGALSLGDAVGGDLYVGGNWTKGGAATFNPNGRAVRFNGSADQTITGETTFSYLTLNKSAGNLLLANNVTVNNTLTLTNGKLVLGNNDLSILDGADYSLSGGSATSYIVTNGTGAFKRLVGIGYAGSSFDFPVGNASARQLATIIFTGQSATHTLAARFITGASGTAGLPLTEGESIARTANDGYWEINAASATADAYTATFVAKGFTDITDYTKVHLLKRADAGSNWTLNGTHVTTTGSNTLASLQRTGMSGFSQFAVGGFHCHQ